ncbi:MAG: PIG-L deacetylase family protein [Dehalococcoidales bacterium]|jgi:LmbE family N-acetylglucosaminyl deacetylase|nr:PIG-L deacetylase family protein [Dehalococcoidales bacterium]
MMTSQVTDLLVVSPHPDDAEFGMAGTVAKYYMEGKTVVYVIVTGGEKGSEDKQMTPEKLKSARRLEQLAAAKILGVKTVEFLGFIDGSLEDNYELRLAITRQIRRYKPLAVATTDPYRRYLLHRDHRITGLVVAEAVYPFARNRPAFPELIEEDPESHMVKEMLFWGSEDPNYYVDITDSFNRKIDALKCHSSQLGSHNEKNLELWLRQRAQEMASGQNYPLAEAFHRVIIDH